MESWQADLNRITIKWISCICDMLRLYNSVCYFVYYWIFRIVKRLLSMKGFILQMPIEKRSVGWMSEEMKFCVVDILNNAWTKQFCSVNNHPYLIFLLSWKERRKPTRGLIFNDRWIWCGLISVDTIKICSVKKVF